MIRILAASAFAVLATTSVANAQDFDGDCTARKDVTTCEASGGWCRWVKRSAITLPNGQVFEPKGYCGFKPGLKQAWQSTQAGQ